ncbi:MAG TPA: hypothetical protein VH593_07000 [Ktedonobacteraceae bacterium]|jgi:hypothetical protein
MATRDELYAKFGITAEAAQLFETDLNTLLLMTHFTENGWHIEPDRELGLRFVDSIDRDTLGQLLKRLSKKFDDNLKDRFASALKARNRLIHGFYERHDFKIQTDEGRDIMIADLEKLHEELFQAWQVASTITALTERAMLEHIEEVATPQRKEEIRKIMQQREKLLERYLPKDDAKEEPPKD